MKTENIATFFVGLVAIDFLIANQRNPVKINFVKSLPGNYNAQTIPPFGINILETEIQNQNLKNHELFHWKQYQDTGAILYAIRYGIERVLYGYDKMPMEIEARKSVNENQYCIDNYTECVRNGLSITVQNPDFRK